MSLVEKNVVETVLIVDDDLLMQKLLAKLVQGMGLQAVIAPSAEEALRQLEQPNIRLVLTDLNMPGMNGQEFCRVVRAKEYGRYIYIVMVTAQDDTQSLVDAMQAGANDFIAKPVNLIELQARINSGLRVLTLESSLETKNQNLNKALAQIQMELEEAKATLMGILPPPKTIAATRFDWHFAASSYVGGDIFDYFAVGSDYLVFYVVDVSGHGVMAAMQAFAIHNEMNAIAPLLLDGLAKNKPLEGVLADFVAQYNNAFIKKNRTDNYFTMNLCVLNHTTGALYVVPAGHPPAIYLTSAQAQFIGDGGFPMGMVRDVSFDVIQLQIENGARICLYSDGITECKQASSAEMYGDERLSDVLFQGVRHPLTQSLEQFKHVFHQWKGEEVQLQDDVTCLILEYHAS